MRNQERSCGNCKDGLTGEEPICEVCDNFNCWQPIPAPVHPIAEDKGIDEKIFKIIKNYGEGYDINGRPYDDMPWIEIVRDVHVRLDKLYKIKYGGKER